MVKCYLNLSIFTVFLKNRNFISKIRRSKVTDYAALRVKFQNGFNVRNIKETSGFCHQVNKAATSLHSFRVTSIPSCLYLFNIFNCIYPFL